MWTSVVLLMGLALEMIELMAIASSHCKISLGDEVGSLDGSSHEM